MKAFLFLIIFISVLVFVTATEEHIIFNNDFLSNTTLYSNTSFFNQVNFTGRDVYPIRENCTIETVCKSWNYYYNKTCLDYSTRTTNRDGTPRCIKWERKKIILDCKKYRNIMRCAPVINTTIICYNPSGKATNQLKLENFFYTTNGINWNNVSYTKINLSETNLTFKVDIPLNCTPAYDINKAINLSYSAD